MSIKVPQASFSSGELTPALHERTTLAKYKNGLRTGRNVIISRTGSILSRPSRYHLAETKINDSAVTIYAPPRTGIFLEWGHLYVRVYNFLGLLDEVVHDFTAGDVSSLQFETSGDFVYIFCYGKPAKKLDLTVPSAAVFVSAATMFLHHPAPATNSITPTGVPGGYGVDYQVTYVKDGQESFPCTFSVGAVIKLPIAAGTSNNINVKISTGSYASGVTEMRVYRKPYQGGAFGFIGISSSIGPVGADLVGVFEDFGGGADYTNTPPTVVNGSASLIGLSPSSWLSRTGIVYQQRLVLTEYLDQEAILVSRPGYQNDFFRDYPLQSDSALKMKAAASGWAPVLRFLENDGLVAFTGAGVFLNQGALGVNNLAFEKKGKWVIDVRIPPLAVPGGVFFVDAATKTIRNLVWSTELGSYNGSDLTSYSEHMFSKKQITSWGFQEGAFPLLWVTFNDGTFASFTYEFDQEMKAWTRHDSSVFVESVAQTGVADRMVFVVKKGTKRYIEITHPKVVPTATSLIDPESPMNASMALMDSMVSYASHLNATPISDDFSLDPLTPGDWAGLLTLKCESAYGPFTVAGPGVVGTIFRFFDEDTLSAYDLEVTARTSDNIVTVRPSIEIPTEFQAVAPAVTGLRLYLTTNTVTGLDHMEGESVAVIIDGGVVASPNNDIEDYPEYVVTGGVITFPVGVVGAIIHVGRPIVADVETLDVDTVEQQPTVIESMTCNKLYVKVNNSIGLYVGNRFVPDDKVEATSKVPAMQDLDNFTVDYDEDEPIVGNTYKQPSTKRVEIVPPGDWKTSGRVAIRQVDPYPFEILSIIPDLDIERRSDR